MQRMALPGDLAADLALPPALKAPGFEAVDPDPEAESVGLGWAFRMLLREGDPASLGWIRALGSANYARESRWGSDGTWGGGLMGWTLCGIKTRWDRMLRKSDRRECVAVLHENGTKMLLQCVHDASFRSFCPLPASCPVLASPAVQSWTWLSCRLDRAFPFCAALAVGFPPRLLLLSIRCCVSSRCPYVSATDLLRSAPFQLPERGVRWFMILDQAM